MKYVVHRRFKDKAICGEVNLPAKEAREWAISNGLINGTGTEVNGEPNYAWADQLTREQAAALFYRFAKLMGKA